MKNVGRHTPEFSWFRFLLWWSAGWLGVGSWWGEGWRRWRLDAWLFWPGTFLCTFSHDSKTLNVLHLCVSFRREIDHMKKLSSQFHKKIKKKICRKYDRSVYLTWTPFILTAFFQSFNLAFSPMYMNFFGVTKLWSSSSMHSLCIPGQVNSSLCSLPLKFPQDTSSILASGSFLPKYKNNTVNILYLAGLASTIFGGN